MKGGRGWEGAGGWGGVVGRVEVSFGVEAGQSLKKYRFLIPEGFP
jgi:hypothetical protein